MKYFFLTLMATLALTASAAELKLLDYDWKLTDISEKGLNKEDPL